MSKTDSDSILSATAPGSRYGARRSCARHAEHPELTTTVRNLLEQGFVVATTAFQRRLRVYLPVKASAYGQVEDCGPGSSDHLASIPLATTNCLTVPTDSGEVRQAPPGRMQRLVLDRRFGSGPSAKPFPRNCIVQC